MKKRNKIRISMFVLSLFTAMLIWGITSTVSAGKYKTQVNVAQQRALTQMCECLDNIEVGLTKSMYAGGSMLGEISRDLQKDAANAKVSLAVLSSGDRELMNIYKFLSQVGAYTASLNEKISSGGTLSSDDRKTLSGLLQFSTALSTQFDTMAELLNSNYFSFEALNDSLMTADTGSESMVSYLSAVSDAEDAMTDFPTLIYDGPFSDNIMNKSSKLLENADEISVTKAKALAAEYLNVEERMLIDDGESNGKIAAFSFHTDKKRIAVTKNGGYLAYIISESAVGEEKLTRADATDKASEFLNNAGYTGMVSTYSAATDGVLTVNFAYKLNAYICYPDLIKVGVALDSGDIVSLDASDYIMNHIERTLPEVKINEDEARSLIANTLTVKDMSPALIPTKGGGEVFTYEFLCDAADGQDILVYINVATGKEENILILLYSDKGALTK